jgi:hypothetical protein
MRNADVALDILILQHTAGTGIVNLVLETSISAEGPWTPLATFAGGYCKTTKYFTAREGGTDKFERFIRQPSGVSSVRVACVY